MATVSYVQPVRISQEMRDKIAKLAEQEDRPVATMTRLLIERGVAAMEAQSRDAPWRARARRRLAAKGA